MSSGANGFWQKGIAPFETWRMSRLSFACCNQHILQSTQGTNAEKLASPSA
jgi:hypothetical protein